MREVSHGPVDHSEGSPQWPSTSPPPPPAINRSRAAWARRPEPPVERLPPFQFGGPHSSPPASSARTASGRSAGTPEPAFEAGVAPVREQAHDGRAEMTLAIHLLGRPFVERDGVPMPSPRGHKPWALLALLLLSPVPPSRERLASLLFSDAEDPLGSLRWNLAEVRRLLGPDVRLEGDPVRLELPAGAEV